MDNELSGGFTQDDRDDTEQVIDGEEDHLDKIISNVLAEHQKEMHNRLQVLARISREALEKTCEEFSKQLSKTLQERMLQKFWENVYEKRATSTQV